MDTVELLTKFADPGAMKALTTTQRVVAGLITTALGMGITFISLIILQFIIGIMAKLTAEKAVKRQQAKRLVAAEEKVAAADNVLQDEEIVAAISTALAVQLKTSVSNIVIRNIEKVEASSTAWHKAGLAEHMNNSL
ncbi:MAG: OadG family protein [Desulfobacterales bacterium]|nr:OadG family protein [Desulfobacterales bacterium]